MTRLEENIPPNTLVQDLRVGQQQVVEIARALAADARILIMDEPTSALSATEVEVLFKVIRELTSHGVAIVYISHHLEEALEIADYAVVFRDGELVATEEAANVDLGWVVRQMVGREADYDFRDEPETSVKLRCRSRGHGRRAGHRPGRRQRRVAGRARGRNRVSVRIDGCRGPS